MAGQKRDEINGRQSKDSGVLNTNSFTMILSQMFDVLSLVSRPQFITLHRQQPMHDNNNNDDNNNSNTIYLCSAFQKTLPLTKAFKIIKSVDTIITTNNSV